MLAADDVRIWLATLDGSAAGYVLSVIRNLPEHPFAFARSVYELDQIAVSPELQRRGVGTALVRHVLADAKARGFDRVELASWSFNAEAIATWTALGFRHKTVRFEREAS